jgi:hypothetical protein
VLLCAANFVSMPDTITDIVSPSIRFSLLPSTLLLFVHRQTPRMSRTAERDGSSQHLWMPEEQREPQVVSRGMDELVIRRALE